MITSRDSDESDRKRVEVTTVYLRAGIVIGTIYSRNTWNVREISFNFSYGIMNVFLKEFK